MSNATYVGRVINGSIQLPADVKLTENSRVLVIVTDDSQPFGRVATPRLAHPEEARDFVMEVTPDASV